MDDRMERRPPWVPWAITSLVLVVVAMVAFSLGAEHEAPGAGVHAWHWGGGIWVFFWVFFWMFGFRRMWGYGCYRPWHDRRYRRYDRDDDFDDYEEFREWRRRERQRTEPPRSDTRPIT